MLDGYKTYLTATAAFLIALAGVINEYVNGQEIHYELVVTALIALAILFLRKGTKNEVK